MLLFILFQFVFTKFVFFYPTTSQTNPGPCKYLNRTHPIIECICKEDFCFYSFLPTEIFGFISFDSYQTSYKNITKYGYSITEGINNIKFKNNIPHFSHHSQPKNPYSVVITKLD